MKLLKKPIALGKLNAIDMFDGGAKMTYPAPVDSERQRLKYDFIFTKRGNWYYVNSFDNIMDPRVARQGLVCTRKGEKWRIIEVKTNMIVAESPKPRKKAI